MAFFEEMVRSSFLRADLHHSPFTTFHSSLRTVLETKTQKCHFETRTVLNSAQMGVVTRSYILLEHTLMVTITKSTLKWP